MNEMKVQPEEIKAAEEIEKWAAVYVTRYSSEESAKRIAALIASHRPPLVARLVEENEGLRKALVELRAVPDDIEPDAWGIKCIQDHKDIIDEALQSAPALDLAKIAEALEKRIEACRQEWGWRLEKWSESAGCLMPVSHDEGCEACRDLRAALASLREVLHA